MESCGGSPGQDHQSWLAFSLSNHNNYPPPPSPPPHHHHHHHHQLCLFQPPQHPPLSAPFSPPSPPGGVSGASGHQQQQHDLSFMGLQVGLFATTQVARELESATVGGGGVAYETAEFLGVGFPSNVQHQHHEQGGLLVSSSSVAQLAVATTTPTGNNKKSVEGFGHRTSIYRGVTRHRWTGRYEAHLWDNSCRREGQSRKGRQVYLGGYDKEEKAARAYDLAALKYWGPTTTTNFPVSDYEKELEEMKNMSRQEFVASLRRKSSGFSRGASIYRGVTRHHQHGRWQARIGRVAGNKDLYLGTFSTQEEAAEAYDIAAIKFRGLNAVTNFDISRYDVKSIISSNLPVGGMSNKSKSSSDPSPSDDTQAIEGSKSDTHESSSCLPFMSSVYQATTTTSTINFAMPVKPDPSTQNYNWPCLGLVETGESTGYGFLGGGGGGGSGGEYVQQPMGGSASSESGNNGGGNNNINEGYNGYNMESNSNNSNNGNSNTSWIVTPPNLHPFQSPKPNLAALRQTPIFGIE